MNSFVRYFKISTISTLGVISNYADGLTKGYGDKDFIFTDEDGKMYNFIFEKVFENNQEINVCNSRTFLFNLLKNSIDEEELENIKKNLIEAGKKDIFNKNDILLEKFIFVKLKHKTIEYYKYAIKKEGKYYDLNLTDEIKLTDSKGEEVYKEDETFSNDKCTRYIYLVKSIKLIENKKINYKEIFQYLSQYHTNDNIEKTLKSIEDICNKFSIKNIKKLNENTDFYDEIKEQCNYSLDGNEKNIFDKIYKTPEVEEILNKKAQALKKQYNDSIIKNNTKFKLEVTFKFEKSETSNIYFDVTPNMTYKELYNIIKEKSKEIYLDKDPLINNLYINGSLLENPEENSDKILLDIEKIEFLVKKDNKDEEKKDKKPVEEKNKEEQPRKKPEEGPIVGKPKEKNQEENIQKPVESELKKPEKKKDEKQKNGGCCNFNS